MDGVDRAELSGIDTEDNKEGKTMDRKRATERINQIPIEIVKLKKEHKKCVRNNWIVPAARLRREIDKLEEELNEAYDSFRKGEK